MKPRPTYRVEREPMPSGSLVQLYRVVIRLRSGSWGTVQTGLLKPEADELCDKLLENERIKSMSRLSQQGQSRIGGQS